MDFGFTVEEESFRKEVRAFIEKELPPDSRMAIVNSAEDAYREDVWEIHKVMARKLSEKGWLTLGWPPEWGGKEGSSYLPAILQEEMRYFGSPGFDAIGVAMIAPTLLRFGTNEQKKEHLPKIARGERFWCQGFSEPGAGSDLSSLQTKAIEKNERLIVNGGKIWTSGAHRADWCFFLARTDPTAAKKNMGISFLLVDMKTPGIQVRPIEDMGGGRGFCEVFFDEVEVPRKNLVGEKNKGWEVALALLDFERGLALGHVGEMRGMLDMLVNYVSEAGLNKNPIVRQRLSDMAVQVEIAHLLAYRVVWMATQGVPASSQVSMSKAFAAQCQQRFANMAMNLLGSYGQLKAGSKYAALRGLVERWYLESFSFTLAGGTLEIQKNIIASRGLGLHRS